MNPLVNNTLYYYYYVYDYLLGLDKANIIIKNLYLGDVIASNDIDFLVEEKVKLVINLSNIVFLDEQAALKQHDIKVTNIAVRDHPDDVELLLSHIPQLVDDIHEYISNNKKVLVNCYAGRQRSAAVVACYLIKYAFLDSSEIQKGDKKELVDLCIKFIQMKRPNAFTPKANFYNAILKYSKSI
jgi:protein-tyrosine phosphatase